MVPQLECLFVVEVVAVAVESAAVVAVVAKFAVVVAVVAIVCQDRLHRLSQPVDRVAAALAVRQLLRLQQLRQRRLDARAQARQELLAANGPASQPPVI